LRLLLNGIVILSPGRLKFLLNTLHLLNLFSAVSRSQRYHGGTGCPQIDWNRKRRQLAIRKAQNEALIRIRSVVTAW